MLHLFNSCYVYPDFLFRPTDDYIIVGENHLSYSGELSSSFYYSYSDKKSCLGKFETYEDFIGSDLFVEVVNKSTKTIIFSDTTSYIKFYTGLLQAHIKNLSQEFYLTAIKLLAVKLGVRANSYIYTQNSDNILNLKNSLLEIGSLERVQDFPLDKIGRAHV